jgi:hypothetical protein
MLPLSLVTTIASTTSAASVVNEGDHKSPVAHCERLLLILFY